MKQRTIPSIHEEDPLPGTVVYPVHVMSPEGQTKTVSAKLDKKVEAEGSPWRNKTQGYPAKRRGRKPYSERIKDPSDSLHGTEKGYQAGCRCKACREATSVTER